jgi:hypothetical protein
LLSVAIKDEEVIWLLIERRAGFSQSLLLEYLLEGTEEECRTWELIQNDSALRLLGITTFLKTRLPIETMTESGVPEAGPLLHQREAAYFWLNHQERRDLRTLARFVIEMPFNDFQDRLEKAVMSLIGLWLIFRAGFHRCGLRVERHSSNVYCIDSTWMNDNRMVSDHVRRLKFHW